MSSQSNPGTIALERIVLGGERLELTVPGVDYDPLVVVDALSESRLLEFRIHSSIGAIALLFDFRTGLNNYFDQGNAGLLVIRSAGRCEWDRGFPSVAGSGGYRAVKVTSSVPKWVGDVLEFEFEFFEIEVYPGPTMSLSGGGAEFYVLNVEGLGDEIPVSTMMPLEEVAELLPSWSSRVEVVARSVARPEVG